MSGRRVDHGVLATDINAEHGLITCAWDRTGQMARQSMPERSCTGADLIPVSGVGDVVGEEKIGGNGV